MWLSWTIPLELDAAKRPPDVAQLVLAQLSEANDRITGGRIDYYRVRVLPDGRVRGRAGCAVPFGWTVPCVPRQRRSALAPDVSAPPTLPGVHGSPRYAGGSTRCVSW